MLISTLLLNLRPGYYYWTILSSIEDLSSRDLCSLLHDSIILIYLSKDWTINCVFAISLLFTLNNNARP